MSGGVDSSVAAALLVEAGHEVVGVTMKLWDGGPAASGCCSVAEVEDARRVAQQLGINHWVFNFTDDFEARVVAPYAEGHAAGLTPNPCIECNRHLKFGRLLRRAAQLGFDGVGTGHHARVIHPWRGGARLRRGADAAKDQSYVLYVLTAAQLARCLFPVGEMTKAEVRARASALGLRTAAKPDSQDVCFVTAGGGRRAFLGERIPLAPGRVLDAAGARVGEVEAVQLVTVGQRKGLAGGGGPRRYALSVDVPSATVVVGPLADLLTESVTLTGHCWADGPPDPTEELLAQTSAHGRPAPATVEDGGRMVRFRRPQRRVAPGQSVVLYRGDEVVGGGVAG